MTFTQTNNNRGDVHNFRASDATKPRNVVTGVSDAFTITATEATESDLALLEEHTGSEVSVDEVAIVTAVAFDDSKNRNGCIHTCRT